MIAYHFVGKTLRDGRPVPPDGEWLEHDGPVVMCESGLHASIDPFDALLYAPGETLCMVELEGDVVTERDKAVGRRRKIIKRFDATAMLRLFARQRALSVIHLWDAPAIVREYLETGDESKRLDAHIAARSAADSAADSAAWSAYMAANSAAWSAYRAANIAADSAAWSAAWSAYMAAHSAADSAAWSAVDNAAWSATWSAARQSFNALVAAEFEKVTP